MNTQMKQYVILTDKGYLAFGNYWSSAYWNKIQVTTDPAKARIYKRSCDAKNSLNYLKHSYQPSSKYFNVDSMKIIERTVEIISEIPHDKDAEIIALKNRIKELENYIGTNCNLFSQ